VSRRLLLLLALGGCDRVFGLDREVPPPVCGPFGPPEEVTFASQLGDAHDLSVEPGGQRGMVFASAGGWIGAHAVKPGQDPNSWDLDPARDRDNLRSVNSAHVTSDGAAMGWLLGTRGHMISMLTFSATMWSASTETIEQPLDSDATIGNVIVLPAGSVLKLKVATQIVRVTEDAPGALVILERNPTGTTWSATQQALPFSMAKTPYDFDGAVLTADHERLVYTARIGNDKKPRAFATRRSNDRFAPGVELIIDGVDPDSGITEPWIDEDCTELYFRNDDRTWVTTAVSP
jgi:hypothetical protein